MTLVIFFIHVFSIFYFLAGYSVFVVNGALPDCEAEQRLALIPPEKLTPLKTTNSKSTVKRDHLGKDLKRTDEESKQIHEGKVLRAQNNYCVLWAYSPK